MSRSRDVHRRLARSGLPAGFVLAAAFVARAALGHEGHAPLPSKGVEVDVERGTIVVSAAAVRALQVDVAEVVSAPLDTHLLAYARLVAPSDRHGFVATGVGGRVSAVFAKPGQAVRRGERLATISSLDFETIQLELLTARAERVLAEETFARLARLATAQIAAERELFDARAAAEQARAAVAVAASKLRILGVGSESLDRLLGGENAPILREIDVVSPLDGTIVHGDVTVGAVVSADQHLFEVVDGRDVRVRIDVLERDIARVRVGQTAEITLAAHPGEPQRVAIESQGLWLDERSSVGDVWARLANPPGATRRFVPGMSGRARISDRRDRGTVVVPATAVARAGLERFVLVEEAATQRGVEYRRQNVVVEGTSDGMVHLREGDLFPGDRVVSVGTRELASFFVSGVLRVSPEAEAAAELGTEPASMHRIDETLEFDGIVDLPPGSRAVVAPQVPGRVTAIHVDRGRSVTAGEVLAEISSLAFLDMQLELAQAASQERLHAASLRRLVALETSEGIPRKRVLEVEAALVAATGRVESLVRKLRAVGLGAEDVTAVSQQGRVFESLPIRSPIGGGVVRFEGAIGKVIRADEALLEIHDPRHAWVRGFLRERDVGRLGDGAHAARVRFVAAPGRVFDGAVVRSDNVVDTDDRTLSVWVELDAADGIEPRHGMLARITIPLSASAPVLAVPLTAIVEQGTRAHVFVRGPDGLFTRRPVERGRSDDRRVEITAGLEPGEDVVVTGATDLQTGFAAIR